MKDQFDLNGKLPTELFLLSSLQSLSLTRNELYGTLPSELGNLGGLAYFDVRENQLTGSIPQKLYSLEGLVHVGLSFNPLSIGPIPQAIQALSNLKTFLAIETGITGPLPLELMQLTKLGKLEAHISWLCQHKKKLIAVLTTLFRVPVRLGQCINGDNSNGSRTIDKYALV